MNEPGDDHPKPPETLSHYLQSLHHAAGQPSLRAIAAATGISHTQVNHILQGFTRTPSWEYVTRLVAHLDGDPGYAAQLWQATHSSESRIPHPTAADNHAVLTRIEQRLAELTDLLRRHLCTDPPDNAT